MKKIYFRKNGYVIEFTKFNVAFLRYLFARITAFLIDISSFVGLQIGLYFVLKINLIFSAFFGFSAFLIYNIFFSFIFKNKTLGMFVARLQIINYDGHPAQQGKITMRMFVYTIYIIPFIGWFLTIVSFFSLFFNRGMSIVDLLSKSQIASIEFSKAIKDVYDHIN